jgi:hypothetical protein
MRVIEYPHWQSWVYNGAYRASVDRILKRTVELSPTGGTPALVSAHGRPESYDVTV